MDNRIEKLLSGKKGNVFLRKLNTAALRVLGENALAEDAVQDTFEYLAGRDVPVKNDAELEAYLVAAVTNRAIKMKKKQVSTALVDIEYLANYATDTYDENNEKELQYTTMLHCIKQLDIQSRRVFKLRYLQGLNIKTVAKMMKISESKVCRITKQAITDITKMVNDEQKKNI